MNLSERLNAITSMVSPCDSAADIGCDHGFTAISLVESGKVKKVYAADINEGPLLRAKEHVMQHGLEDEISLCLGNGLLALKNTNVDCIIIAGMGGLLIKEILLADVEKTTHAKELLLSPHTDAYEVRKCLTSLSFTIAEEKMIYEEEKYYVVIRAVKCENPQRLSDTECKYGPVLLKEKETVFVNFLLHEKEKKQEIFEKLQKNGSTESAKKKLAELKSELQEIDFILGN